MSLLPKETQVNRYVSLYAPLGSGGGGGGSNYPTDILCSTITNQFNIGSGTLSITGTGAVDTTQRVNVALQGGNTLNIGSQIDNRAIQQASFCENGTGNLTEVMAKGIWASGNGGLGAEAVYTHASGYPYVYTQMYGSNVDVLKVNPDFTTALTNISSINGGALSNVSSINGVIYPPPGSGSLQISQVSPPSASGVSVAPSSWIPFVSTSVSFNFTANKTYDISLPVSLNITTGVNDSKANVFLGGAIQGVGIPATCDTLNLPINTSQIGQNGVLRFVQNAPATGSLPLVYSLYVQGTTSTIVASGSIPAGFNNLVSVAQLN